MGYYVKNFFDDLDELFDFIFANMENKKLMWYVPKYCRNCEVLGICRDKDNKWKCRRGCMIINQSKHFK